MREARRHGHGIVCVGLWGWCCSLFFVLWPLLPASAPCFSWVCGLSGTVVSDTPLRGAREAMLSTSSIEISLVSIDWLISKASLLECRSSHHLCFSMSDVRRHLTSAFICGNQHINVLPHPEKALSLQVMENKPVLWFIKPSVSKLPHTKMYLWSR